MRSYVRIVRFLASTMVMVTLGAVVAPLSLAQSAPGTISGTLTDPSAAVVGNATVTLTPSRGGGSKTTTTNQRGVFEFQGVAPGAYTLTATVSGFAIYVKENVEVRAGQIQTIDIQLAIETEKQQVQVTDESGTKVDLSPGENVSSVVITEKDLDAFSDDPDELESELAALAGPSVGPNGGQFYVDGFSVEDQLPPKNSIREIRVNQNPFSTEYDALGYGRVEIFTKPGTNQFHGRFTVEGNDLIFDTRDPFAAGEPGYHSLLATADVSGPINKKASFFLDFQHRNIQGNAVVNGVILDPNFNQVPFAQTIANPTSRTVIGPRVDYQLSTNNTLSASYQFAYDHRDNLGIGQFALASQGYNTDSTQHVVRLNDTQIISARIVNDLRFQYRHEGYTQTPLSQQPEISVLGAFVGGGSNMGILDYHHLHTETDNITSIALNKHYLRFGGRLRTVTEPYIQTPDFNGTYTFSSLNAYQITSRGLAQGLTASQIAAAGGGPTQFTLTSGASYVRIFSVDAGIYAEDDWRIRPNVSLSYGLRFETQNYIKDHADWAPRVGIAWGLGRGANRSPKTVLRVGFGMFYDRFGQPLQIQAETLNGIRQTEYIVRNPTFYPVVPTVAALAAASAASTVYQVAPGLRAPYTIQSAASVERQVTKAVTISVTYLNSRGVHQFITNNINAPEPGTYNPAIPLSGIRPLPTLGNIYEYESIGIFEQNQLINNFTVRAARNVSLFGFYSLNYANSDTGGAASFPSNPYNIAQDYGRAAFDIRHRIVTGGSITLRRGILVSPLVTFQSGTPFNITVGQDLNGSTIFNQRPAVAAPSTPLPDVVATRYGTFNLDPGPDDTRIPINYGVGPANFTMNLRISKTFGFGSRAGEHAAGDASAAPSGGGGGGGQPGFGVSGGRPGTTAAGTTAGAGLGNRGLSGNGGGGSGGSASKRYSITISAAGRNIFNIVNLAPPVGNLTSPLFGRSNALAGGAYSFSGTNRRIDFQLVFSF